MAIDTHHPIQRNSIQLRLKSLMRLRWLAISGQLLTVIIVTWLLEINFHWIACLALIFISVALNIVLRLLFPARTRLSPEFAMWLLLYDVLSIGALLYMTGGIENPFIFLIIAPSIISATTLSLGKTSVISLITVVIVGLLFAYHEPLPWFTGQKFNAPLSYQSAVAASILASLLYIAAAAYILSAEARQMTSALAAAETVLAREQQLSALDGLAAAAAHELGTPLGTIYVTTRELMRTLPEDDELAQDVKLINSQAERCREILTKLTRSPGKTDALLKKLTLSELVAEVAEPYRHGEINIEIKADPLYGEFVQNASEPECNRCPGVSYGLGNLIENAVGFAESVVSVTANWTDKEISIVIADDGPGFSSEIIDTLGEPFVTTRSVNRQNLETTDGSGLGLGFFIAKTLLERSGARLTLANRFAPDHGAVIRITWSRDKFEPLEMSSSVSEIQPLRSTAA